MKYQFLQDKKTYQNKLKDLKNLDSIKFHRYLTGLLKIEPSDSVLDLGCGHGQTLLHITQKLSKNGKAIGVDIGEHALAVAERVLKDEIVNDKLELIRYDVSKGLPFSSGIFKKIICHNVLECIPDKTKFINECFRVMKSGGILIMSHSDFDTQLYNSLFPDLTRKLIHTYADTKQEWMKVSDGMIGRKLPGIFKKTKFKTFEVETYVMNNVKFEPFQYGFSSAKNIVDIANKTRKFKKNELNNWLEDLKRKGKAGDYFYSININIIKARK